MTMKTEAAWRAEIELAIAELARLATATHGMKPSIARLIARYEQGELETRPQAGLEQRAVV